MFLEVIVLLRFWNLYDYSINLLLLPGRTIWCSSAFYFWVCGAFFSFQKHELNIILQLTCLGRLKCYFPSHRFCLTMGFCIFQFRKIELIFQTTFEMKERIYAYCFTVINYEGSNIHGLPISSSHYVHLW